MVKLQFDGSVPNIEEKWWKVNNYTAQFNFRYFNLLFIDKYILLLLY